MLGVTSLFSYHICFLNNGKCKGLFIVNNMLFFKDNTIYVSFPSKLNFLKESCILISNMMLKWDCKTYTCESFKYNKNEL